MQESAALLPRTVVCRCDRHSLRPCKQQGRRSALEREGSEAEAEAEAGEAVGYTVAHTPSHRDTAPGAGGGERAPRAASTGRARYPRRCTDASLAKEQVVGKQASRQSETVPEGSATPFCVDDHHRH